MHAHASNGARRMSQPSSTSAHGVFNDAQNRRGSSSLHVSDLFKNCLYSTRLGTCMCVVVSAKSSLTQLKPYLSKHILVDI